MGEQIRYAYSRGGTDSFTTVIAKLEKSVNEFIEAGYALHGSISAVQAEDYIFLIQPMALPIKSRVEFRNEAQPPDIHTNYQPSITADEFADRIEKVLKRAKE